MSKVSIVKCPDYSSVKEALAGALDLIGGLESVIQPGDNVLLKPNILAASPPENAVTTHPAVVTAMCKFVLEAGGKPAVGDGAEEFPGQELLLKPLRFQEYRKLQEKQGLISSILKLQDLPL